MLYLFFLLTAHNIKSLKPKFFLDGLTSSQEYSVPHRDKCSLKSGKCPLKAKDVVTYLFDVPITQNFSTWFDHKPDIHFSIEDDTGKTVACFKFPGQIE